MGTSDQTATAVDTSPQDRRNDQRRPKVGEMLGERFLLRAILGSGATGTVFAAIDVFVGQKVAVKVLHPELRDSRTRERLRREVRASRSDHSNIVSIFDLHELNGHLFLSMELIEGRSMRSLLERETILPVSEVVEIGRQIAAGIGHLHERGLVHRDVKPGNILLGDDGMVKLCDMGLARPLDEGVTVTETEMVVGTPDYMAPEQATGAELNPAADVYSLGLTLYQALTDEIPLKEPTAIATLSKRQRERPPTIRKKRADCPRWLDRLIRRMLEPKTADRPSATTVFKALETGRLLPKPRRTTVMSAVASLLVVTISFIGAHFMSRKPTTDIEVGKMNITGRDKRGHQTWRRDFDIPVVSEQRADVNGDGNEEVLIVLKQDNQTRSRSTVVEEPEIWIFQNDGRVLSRFLPERKAVWEFDYDVKLWVTLHLLDLDHDGRREVVVVGQHLNFFPSVVFLYRVGLHRWDQVLTHPGKIVHVRATSPKSGNGLQFLAVNNRLGVLGFLGDISIAENGGEDHEFNIRDGRQATLGLRSPPFSGMSPAFPYRWNAYVPLPLNSGRFLLPASIDSNLGNGGIKLVSDEGAVLTYDENWNPTPGPNAGRDLKSLRLAFMTELSNLSPESQRLVQRSTIDQRSEMLIRFKPLLAETPYRLIMDIKSARTMARSDRLEEAREILHQTARETGHEDAIYRLAHFEALSGRNSAGIDLLTGLMKGSGRKEFGTRASFDGPQLALRIGIESHDSQTVDVAIATLSSQGASTAQVRVAKSLRARARLWWDQLQPEDLSVESWAYSPEGEAIACIARWRQSVNLPDDVGALDGFIQRNPDAAFEGRLAQSAALLGANRNTEALDELSILVQELIFPSKDDFANHQLLDFARAMRVVALKADGQIERARTEGAELIPTLTPDLLPAILVGEVLDGPGGAKPSEFPSGNGTFP